MIIREWCEYVQSGNYPEGGIVKAAKTSAGRTDLPRQLQQEQNQLLILHADETWPEGTELTEWLKLLMQDHPDWRSLFIIPPPGTDFRFPVLNAPIVAALIIQK